MLDPLDALVGLPREPAEDFGDGLVPAVTPLRAEMQDFVRCLLDRTA